MYKMWHKLTFFICFCFRWLWITYSIYVFAHLTFHFINLVYIHLYLHNYTYLFLCFVHLYTVLLSNNKEVTARPNVSCGQLFIYWLLENVYPYKSIYHLYVPPHSGEEAAQIIHTRKVISHDNTKLFSARIRASLLQWRFSTAEWKCKYIILDDDFFFPWSFFAVKSVWYCNIVGFTTKITHFWKRGSWIHKFTYISLWIGQKLYRHILQYGTVH